jgi:hypothetical protein
LTITGVCPGGSVSDARSLATSRHHRPGADRQRERSSIRRRGSSCRSSPCAPSRAEATRFAPDGRSVSRPASRPLSAVRVAVRPVHDGVERRPSGTDEPPTSRLNAGRRLPGDADARRMLPNVPDLRMPPNALMVLRSAIEAVAAADRRVRDVLRPRAERPHGRDLTLWNRITQRGRTVSRGRTRPTRDRGCEWSNLRLFRRSAGTITSVASREVTGR